LAEHGVQPADLVPPLMQNAKVKNPLADETQSTKSIVSGASNTNGETSRVHKPSEADSNTESAEVSPKEVRDREEVPEVKSPDEIPTTDKIELDIRWTVLCDLFLMLISDGNYDARSRLLLERVAAAMDITWVQICRFEKRVIDALEMREAAKENWDEQDHMERRRKLALKRKYMFMGIATVGGGLVLGLSAGLLAPVIGAGLAAGFTTIGISGTTGFLSGVGGAALITSAATAAGGTVAIRASNRRTGAVKTFEYRPLHNNKRLNLIVTVSGWMNGKVDDVRLPYSTVDPIMGDIYSLLWEPEMLQSMGDTINILANEALTQTIQQVLGSTILTALMASLQLPIVLSKLAYLIDNPWSVSLDRANAAGLILADSLIDRHLGNRPITLVGFSLGSRLIFSCLKELASRDVHGLIQNVYLFGSPIVAKKDEYLRARSVIAGRFVNGYASNDWILGYLFRATSGGIMRVAGLAPVEEIPGLENLDVTQLVLGHMAYRASMPKLLREVGWEVESDEFTEIEDPDPENHKKRQRELIREIDEARKEAEAKTGMRRFGLFKRGKLAEKKGWEMYDASGSTNEKSGVHKRTKSDASAGDGVLFDIDAIRKELESEMIEVRELDSTLPPMQISMQSNGSSSEKTSTEIENAKGRQVDALLAQQGLDPEEVKKMTLPPRPDGIDYYSPVRHEHTGSRTGGDALKKGEALRTSLEAEAEEIVPRELKSTLPPLQLSTSLQQTLSGGSVPSIQPVRPELKTYASMPSSSASIDYQAEIGDGRAAAATIQTSLPTSPFAEMGLEHNAWADDEDGKEKEIKLSFE